MGGRGGLVGEAMLSGAAFCVATGQRSANTHYREPHASL